MTGLASSTKSHCEHVYLLKHSLLSNIVKFSVSEQSQAEFMENQFASNNPLEQFSFVYSVLCNDPLAVVERVQETLSAQNTFGELYQVSAQEALKIVKREAMRIPIAYTY